MLCVSSAPDLGKNILIYFILEPGRLEHLSLTSLRMLPDEPDEEWTLVTVAVVVRESDQGSLTCQNGVTVKTREDLKSSRLISWKRRVSYCSWRSSSLPMRESLGRWAQAKLPPAGRP